MNTELKANNKRLPIQPDWWSKTLGGAILGFSLALALSGLFAWLGPGGLAAPNKVQFVMWLIAPLWMLVFSLVYLVPKGWQVVLGLTCANLAAYGALFVVRYWAVQGSAGP